MANTWTISNIATLNSDTVRSVGSSNTTINLVGTGNSIQTANIIASVWSPLITSSLANYRGGYFTNQGDANGSGSITISSGSSGQNVLMRLLPNDSQNHCWDGVTQLPLYAQASNTTSSAVLQYILTSA